MTTERERTLVDFESDPPKEWRASGLPHGYEASTNTDGRHWPWSVKRSGGGSQVIVTGVAESADEAKTMIQDTYKRLDRAFAEQDPTERMEQEKMLRALGEMELARDEWQAKAEAFGHKAHQLQQKLEEHHEALRRFMVDVLVNPTLAAETLKEALAQYTGESK